MNKYLLLPLLLLLISSNIIDAQATQTISQFLSSTSSSVSSFASNPISGISNTALSTASLIALLVIIWVYFHNALIILLFIIVYEFLTNLNIYSSFKGLAQAYLSKSSGFFPTSNERINSESLLAKFNSPFGTLININRALLYGAFLFAILQVIANENNINFVYLQLFENIVSFELVISYLLISFSVLSVVADVVISIYRLTI